MWLEIERKQIRDKLEWWFVIAYCGYDVNDTAYYDIIDLPWSSWRGSRRVLGFGARFAIFVNAASRRSCFALICIPNLHIIGSVCSITLFAPFSGNLLDQGQFFQPLFFANPLFFALSLFLIFLWRVYDAVARYLAQTEANSEVLWRSRFDYIFIAAIGFK